MAAVSALLIAALNALKGLPNDQRLGDPDAGPTVLELRVAVWRGDVTPLEALALLPPVAPEPVPGEVDHAD